MNFFQKITNFFKSLDAKISGLIAGQGRGGANRDLFGIISIVLAGIIALFFLLAFIGNETVNFWLFFNLALFGYCFYKVIKAFKTKNFEVGRLMVVLSVTLAVSFVTLTSITEKTASIVDYETQTDPIALVDLAIDLEDTLKLQDVSLSEAAGGVIEIRTEAPAKVSPEAILSAAGYIFNYVEPSMPAGIKTLRLILTVNGFDASLIEVERQTVAKWSAKQLADKDFFASMRKQSLIK
jgi:hypothetical protein